MKAEIQDFSCLGFKTATEAKTESGSRPHGSGQVETLNAASVVRSEQVAGLTGFKYGPRWNCHQVFEKARRSREAHTSGKSEKFRR